MKLGELANVVESLNVLANKELKTGIGFKLVIFLKKVEFEYQTYIKKRDDIVRIYGESEDGIAFKIKEENKDKYQKDMNELLSLDVEVPDMKIKLSEIEDIKLEGKHMYILSNIIEDDSKTN